MSDDGTAPEWDRPRPERAAPSGARTFGGQLIEGLFESADLDRDSLLAVVEIPGKPARHGVWPTWVPDPIREGLTAEGIATPYRHQSRAAEAAWAGRHVVLSTGTASGKSLAYQLPILSALASERTATALYLAPTKALAADQLRAADRTLANARDWQHNHGSPSGAMDLGFSPVLFDGDTSAELRDFARTDGRWLFSNPDMLHANLLPNHTKWARFLRRLRFIVVDECHHYRGVFGSHTGWVLRRLLRLCRALGGDPVVILASATVANPAEAAGRLIGEPALAIDVDDAPHGGRTIAFWQPPLLPVTTGAPAPETAAPKTAAPVEVRRSAPAEAALIMAALVTEGARTLTFVQSRRAAETTALATRRALEGDPMLAGSIASYRAGYLAADRRLIEAQLGDGTLRGVAATNALELGIDVAGLDAIVMAGFPGTVGSFWQQAGRSGRRGQGALVVLIARADPLDGYLVHNPATLLERPLDAIVTDPTNPHIAGPELLCAAAEKPLTPIEVEAWAVDATVTELAEDGWLRERPQGYFLAAAAAHRLGGRPHDRVSLRGGGGGEVLIVIAETGQVIGVVDAVRAMGTVHEGAVYLHRGDTYVVTELDLPGVGGAHPDDEYPDPEYDEYLDPEYGANRDHPGNADRGGGTGIALVSAANPPYSTMALSRSDITITAVLSETRHGPVTVRMCAVRSSEQVIGYKRSYSGGRPGSETGSGEGDFIPLDFPAIPLETRAVVYSIDPAALPETIEDLPGALHAAEHAAIGMLSLFASCDRWDIGGLSTDLHPDTGEPTVFVYDGHPGGAGFAERGHQVLHEWLTATRAAVAGCECAHGCPSCIQSPKCGNGNEPLSKPGAIALLDLVIAAIARR